MSNKINKMGDTKPRSIQDRLKINQNSSDTNPDNLKNHVDIPSNLKTKWLNSLLKFVKNKNQLSLEYSDMSTREGMFIYSVIRSRKSENSALGFKNLYAPLWESIDKLDKDFTLDVSYREISESTLYLTIEKIAKPGTLNNINSATNSYNNSSLTTNSYINNSSTTNSYNSNSSAANSYSNSYSATNSNVQATNSYNQPENYATYGSQNDDYSAYENYQKWYASYYQSQSATNATNANTNYQTSTNYQSGTTYQNNQTGTPQPNYQTGANYHNTNNNQNYQTNQSNTQSNTATYQDQNYQAWQAWYTYCQNYNQGNTQNYNQGNTQNASQNVSNKNKTRNNQLQAPPKPLTAAQNEVPSAPQKLSQFANVGKGFIVTCFDRILKFTENDNQTSVVFTGLKQLERDFVHNINDFVFSPQKADVLFDAQCKVLLRDLWISMNKMFNRFNIDIRERPSPINSALRDVKLMKKYKFAQQNDCDTDNEIPPKPNEQPTITPKTPTKPIPKNRVIPSLLFLNIEPPKNMTKPSDDSLNNVTPKPALLNKKGPLLEMPTALKKTDTNNSGFEEKKIKIAEIGFEAEDCSSKVVAVNQNATSVGKTNQEKVVDDVHKETKPCAPKKVVSALIPHAIQFQSGGTMNMDNYSTCEVDTVREEDTKKRMDYRKTKLVQAMQTPLSSDKGKRMMEMMGWEGGALGTRGEGIVEPIIPALHIKTGRGLGHVPEQMKGKKGDLKSRVRLLNIVLRFLENEGRDEVEIVYEGGIAKKEAKFPRASIKSFNQRVLMGVSTAGEANLVEKIVNIMLERETLLLDMEMTSEKLKITKKIVDPSKIPKSNKTIRKKLKATAAIPDPATCPKPPTETTENKQGGATDKDDVTFVGLVSASSTFRERILSCILEFIELDIETTEITLEKVMSKKEKRFSHVALNYFNRRHMISLNGEKEMQLVKQVVAAMQAEPSLILTTEVSDKSIKFIKKKATQPAQNTSKKKKKKEKKETKPYPDPTPNLNSEIMTEQEITKLAHDVNQINAMLLGMPAKCSTNKAIRYYKFRIVFLKKIVEFLKSEDKEKELIFEYILNTKLLNFIEQISSTVNKKEKTNLETPLETLLLQEVLSLVKKDLFLKISLHESLQKFTLYKMSYLTNAGSVPEKKPAALTENNAANVAQKDTKDSKVNSVKPAVANPNSSKENLKTKPASVTGQKDCKDNTPIKCKPVGPTNSNVSAVKKAVTRSTTTTNKSNAISVDKIQKQVPREDVIVLISDDDDDDKEESLTSSSADSSKTSTTYSSKANNANTTNTSTSITSKGSSANSSKSSNDDINNKTGIKSNANQNVDGKDNVKISNTHNFAKPKELNELAKRKVGVNNREECDEQNLNFSNSNPKYNKTPVENLDDLPELNTSSESEINEKVFDSSRSSFSTTSSKRSRTDSNNSSTQLRKITKFSAALTNVCIVHKKYPAFKLSEDDIVEIQTVISDGIDNADFLPMLKCHGVHKGCLVYGCNGDKTLYWLFNLLPNYSVRYCTNDIFVENNIFKVTLNIKTYFKDDLAKLFRRIELYNSEVSTDSWQVLDDKFSNGCRVIYLEIDGKSMDCIRDANFCLFAGVDMAQFNIRFE